MMRVAIVEDHSLLCIGIRSILDGKTEIQIVGEAATAKDGLNLLKKTQPDVAIVDVVLPDYNGIELIRKFRASQPNSTQTKFLILTGYFDEARITEALGIGVNSYCIKTTKSSLLLEALQTTYAGDPWLDPAVARIVLKYAQSTDSSVPLVETPLTTREMQVLRLLVQGYKNPLIARKLFISLGTVKTHVRSILNKLCANDRTEAVAIAMRTGIVK